MEFEFNKEYNQGEIVLSFMSNWMDNYFPEILVLFGYIITWENGDNKRKRKSIRFTKGHILVIYPIVDPNWPFFFSICHLS